MVNRDRLFLKHSLLATVPDIALCWAYMKLTDGDWQSFAFAFLGSAHETEKIVR